MSRIGQTFMAGEDERLSAVELPLFAASVRPLEAISTDLLLGYKTRNNWTIRSGLGYTRLNTVAEGRTVTINDSLRREGVVRIDIAASGDSSFVNGIVNVIETSTRTQQYFNHLTLIDVPLLVGRQFNFGKFDLNVEAGPVLNLLARASARLPVSADAFSERSATESRYRTSVGLSWRGQASVGYRLSPKVSVLLGVDYRQLPRRGVEVPNAPVKTRYNLLGGKLGVRYRF